MTDQLVSRITQVAVIRKEDDSLDIEFRSENGQVVSQETMLLLSEKIAGSAGAGGEVGPEGPPGPAGADSIVPGPQGATGPAGPEGVQGPAGPTGATGPAGPQGIQGDTGPTGAAGTGGDGSPGADGIQGPPGPAGADGVDGAAGPQGVEGPQGPQGIQGIIGPEGPQGDPGLDGATELRGLWDIATNYALGDVVQQAENLYQATAPNTGMDPSETDVVSLHGGAVGTTGFAASPIAQRISAMVELNVTAIDVSFETFTGSKVVTVGLTTTLAGDSPTLVASGSATIDTTSTAIHRIPLDADFIIEVGVDYWIVVSGYATGDGVSSTTDTSPVGSVTFPQNMQYYSGSWTSIAGYRPSARLVVNEPVENDWTLGYTGASGPAGTNGIQGIQGIQGEPGDPATNLITSVAGRQGVVVLTKSDVGLSNVDNTADTAKPVSTSQQTALDLKANLASPTFTGTVSGITKSAVGLSNVDNTADTAKPVSTSQQTALDLKANLASPTFTGTPAAPTAAALTNTTQVATTEFVTAAVAVTTNLIDAAGDLLIGSADNTLARLAKGSNGQALKISSGGVLAWETPTKSRQIVGTITGTLILRTGTIRIYNDSGVTLTILSVRTTVGTAPTGAAILADVNKNGTTIFTTQGNRPSIAISGFASSKATPDVTSLADGDYLTFDIDQIGSTIAGADLTVAVEVM